MRRPTTPYIPNVLATPTNVSSPILAAESSIPTTYTTALESTRDDNTVTKQPTSQMNDPNVTPSLFSPIALEPTIIPETPSIYETPMDRMPISPQPDQLSSDRRPSERKNMEESPSYRRRHRVQSRLNDRAKMTSKSATYKGSEDEDPSNIVRNPSKPSRHKDRSCSRDRRQMRTSSEDLSRRHRKKTGSHRVQIQAPSDDSSSSAEDYVDTTKLTHWMKPPKYDGTTAFETFYAQFLNCSVYNQWTKTDQLAYLKGALQNEAGQVLWDYGPEVTDSFKELVKTLKGRFGLSLIHI